jgi:uncharacterized membrane protein
MKLRKNIMSTVVTLPEGDTLLTAPATTTTTTARVARLSKIVIALILIACIVTSFLEATANRSSSNEVSEVALNSVRKFLQSYAGVLSGAAAAVWSGNVTATAMPTTLEPS